eukprot:1180798-Prorocentrum_minimum.AAC.7
MADPQRCSARVNLAHTLYKLGRDQQVGGFIAAGGRFRATGGRFRPTGGRFRATGGKFRVTGGGFRATGDGFMIQGHRGWIHDSGPQGVDS